MISTPSSCSSLLSLTTLHHPLHCTPTVTDFGSLASRSPAPALPPISQQQWLTGMTSSSNLPMDSRPSIIPCNNTSQRRQERGPLVLRKLSQCPNFTTGCHKGFTSGGQRPRSGSQPPMLQPPTERRQRQYSHVWKGLVQAIMHRFTLMSAWRPTFGPHGQIFKWRLKTSSWGTTRSGQGPNSCIFAKDLGRG